MVECTGLENQQSRKVLVGSNPTASAMRPRRARNLFSCAALFLISACASIPGETTAPRALQRDVSERVLGLARKADPTCRQQKITATEMLEVRPDGQSAEELWTVEQCGRRLNYVVSFPPRRGAGTNLGFSVRAER